MVGLFKLLFPKKRGCLYGKTKEQKESFFRSLSDFAISDEQFFKEQLSDLQPHEKDEFTEWVLNHNEQLMAIKALVDKLNELLEEKHKPK